MDIYNIIMTKEDGMINNKILLDILNYDFSRIENYGKKEYLELLELCKKHKILPYVFSLIKGKIPDKISLLFKQEYLSIKKEISYQIGEINLLSQLFEKENIEAIFVKGVALSHIIYRDLFMRKSLDIDIIVNKSLDDVFQSIKKLGYKYYVGTDPKTGEFEGMDKAEMRFADDYYEYQCFKYIDDCVIFIEIKKATSAISEKNIVDFCSNTQSIKIYDREIKTFNDDYTLLHIMANLYENIESDLAINSFISIRDIVDLKCFLEQKENINWERIYLYAKKYQLVSKVRFALYALSCFYNKIPVGKDVIKMFSVEKNRNDIPLNKTGSRYMWKCDLIERIFDSEKRMREYSGFLIKNLIENISKTEIEDELIVDSMPYAKILNASKVDIGFKCENEQYFFCFKGKNMSENINNIFFYVVAINLQEKNSLVKSEFEIECIEKQRNDYMEDKIMYKLESVFCKMIYFSIEIRKRIGANGFRRLGPKYEWILEKK